MRTTKQVGYAIQGTAWAKKMKVKAGSYFVALLHEDHETIVKTFDTFEKAKAFALTMPEPFDYFTMTNPFPEPLKMRKCWKQLRTKPL